MILRASNEITVWVGVGEQIQMNIKWEIVAYFHRAIPGDFMEVFRAGEDALNNQI